MKPNANLFRWSKLVDPEDESTWETTFFLEEIAFTVEKMVNRKKSRLAVFCQSRADAEAIQSRHGGGVTEIRPEDWEPSIDPSEARVLRIRDQFVVSETDDAEALAELAAENQGREVLSFPPQLAFGTGGHPTTANCLRLLVDASANLQNDSDWRFLDLGCGSGILSVAAAKLGASQSIAIELDGRALGFAEQNGTRHQVANQVDYQLADVLEWLRQDPAEHGGPFDIVAANLFSDLLEEVLPLLQTHGWVKPSGTLIVSGFLTSQTQLITAAAEASGMPLQTFLRRGKWVAASSLNADKVD